MRDVTEKYWIAIRRSTGLPVWVEVRESPMLWRRRRDAIYALSAAAPRTYRFIRVTLTYKVPK